MRALIHFLFLFFMLYCATLPAQKHDAFSFFGYDNTSSHPLFGGGTIDFNFTPPKIFKQKKKIDFGSYCGSCSDSLGYLLFYTNGISIQHRQHNLMENGDSLNLSGFWYEFEKDGYPVAGGARAIPAPGLQNQYYLFSMGGRYEPALVQIVLAPLWYSRIDMNQNNGLGRVVEKNKVLLDVPINEFVIAKHGNGRDWWVLAPHLSKNIFYTFYVGPGGITGPFEQVAGPVYTEKETPSFCNISPNGEIFVRHDSYAGLHIYDFERCTGQLSNLRIVPYQDGFRSTMAAFSPDSRYMYLSSYDALMVLDMQSPDPALTLDTLSYYDGFATPVPFNTGFWIAQLQEDGKIYYATTNGTRALHVIHHPGLPGLSADIEQHGIILPVFNSGTMCRFPNYRLGRLIDAPCDTLGFQGPPPSGFTHTPYITKAIGAKDYKTLSPLRGNSAPDIRPSDMLEYSIEQARRRKAEREKHNIEKYGRE